MVKEKYTIIHKLKENKLSRHDGEIRIQGMQFATEQVEKMGLEEWKKSLKKRANYRISLPIGDTELHEVERTMGERVYGTMLVMFCWILKDQFGYGRKRLQRFVTAVEQTANEMIPNGYDTKNIYTFRDLEKQLEIDTGISLMTFYDDEDPVK